MTGRDIAWRAGGVLLLAGASVDAQLGLGGDAAIAADVVAAIAGIVLAVNGRRTAILLRAERRGHALTAGAVHAARLRRARGG